MLPLLGAVASTTSTKPKTAVVFSGGGARAYVAALGQLEALRSLGLLQKTDHISGVSGGGWAAVIHCWRGEQTTSAPLLGPEELDWPELRAIPKDATHWPHLAFTRRSLLWTCARKLAQGQPLYEAWRAALEAVLLRPIGVPDGACFTWDDASARRIQRRRGTKDASPLLPCSQGVPYPHIAAAVLGPAGLAPFDLTRRAFACLEITPRAVSLLGGARRRCLSCPAQLPAPYSRRRRRRTRLQDRRSGDGDGCAQESAAPFSLADALAVTSFFPGAPLATTACDDDDHDGQRWWSARKLGRAMAARARRALAPLCSCMLPLEALAGASGLGTDSQTKGAGDGVSATKQQGSDDGGPDGVLLADGGSVSNLPLPLLLAQPEPPQRVVCILNVGEPLPTGVSSTCATLDRSHPPTAPSARSASSSAPPAAPGATHLSAEHLSAEHLSEDLAALFGVLAPTPNPSKDLTRAQVFSTAEFEPLVDALQARLRSGRGALATTRHTTVRNDYWGVRAGLDVAVTWVYIGRAAAWEARLPPRVRRALPPDAGRADGRPPSRLGDASRASVWEYVKAVGADATRGLGRPLDAFPQYPLTRLRLRAVEANALYQLSGWVLLEHGDELREILLPASEER